MKIQIIKADRYKEVLLKNAPVIDVRAPTEFTSGSVPGAVNLPILSNEERHKIGHTYKHQGREKAIDLGFRIVSGDNKATKLEHWISYILYQKSQNQDKVYITCFRGGQRSQISQQWILESGYETFRFETGYKGFRQWSIEHLKELSLNLSLKVISGYTGSGKTLLLKELKDQVPIVDLEGIARHKGSAFGAEEVEQPCQADFESSLLKKILQQQDYFSSPLVIEDESRVIGSVHLPEEFFLNLRNQKIILLDTTLEERVENIYKEYILLKNLSNSNYKVFDDYQRNVKQIAKRLGFKRASEIIDDIEMSKNEFVQYQQTRSNKIWIEKLMSWYYDPRYSESLQKRNPVIEFKGTTSEVRAFLKSATKLR